MKRFKKIGISFIFLLAITLAVSNADTMQAATGYTDHKHTWETPSKCGTCGGDHLVSTTCSSCGGEGGKYTTQVPNNNGTYKSYRIWSGCTSCGGAGTSTDYFNYTNYVGGVAKNSKTSNFKNGSGTVTTNCSKCYASGTYKGKNTRCTRSGCTKTSYAAWSDYPNGVCYTTENIYTIKFQGNGATSGSTANMSCYYDNAYTLTANGYTRTGYTFLGWSTSSTATTASYANKASVSKLSSVNGATVTLYAVWKANTYSVTYDANGGTDAPAKQDFVYNSTSYISASEPIRTGYTFLNWWATHTTSTYFTPGDVIPAGWGSFTLQARWNPNDYTLTLEANGGTCVNGAGETVDSVTTTFDSTNFSELNYCIPTRTGYTFKGWYTALEGGTQVYDADGMCTNEGTYWKDSKWAYADNVTLYAQWEQNEYTVTYDANGGSTETLTKTYYYEDEIDLSPEAAKNGYQFVGWSTEPDAEIAISTLLMPDLATSDNSDYADDWEMTLYAVYSIEVSDVANHTYPAYEKVKENEVYLLVWEKNNDANYEIYPLTYEYDTNRMVYRYTLEEDISDFASGLQTYYYQIIAYDNAGNHKILKADEITGGIPQDEPVVPDPPPDVVKNEYLQTTNHYRYDAITKSWIKFDTTSEKIEEGKTYQPSCITPPTGYCTYQLTSPKGTATLTNNALTSTTVAYTVSGAHTNSAYYKPINYTLTLDRNDGSGSVTTKSISYGDYYGTLPTPERKGWTSTGWYTTSTGGTKVNSSDKYLTAGDLTIYAHWTRNVHTVTYDYWTNGGTNVSLAGKDTGYGLAVDLTPIAQKTGDGLNGWIFVGWNTDPDATTALRPNDLTMPDEDVTLFAIFKKTIIVTVKERSGTSSVNTRNLTATIYNNETEADFTIEQNTTWSGWTLLGYTTETEPTAVPLVAVGGRYTTGESTTLHALYSSIISLIYDTNGSAMTFDTQSKEAYHNVTGGYEYPTFTIMSVPSLSDHSFVNWKVQSGTITDVIGTTVSSCLPGNVVILTSNATLTAQWDAFPEIEAYNRYFTLEQAKNGQITEAVLLEKVVGRDKEDGTLVNEREVIVLNYDASAFTGISTDQEVEITYQATDSFGNTVTKTVTITVTDTTAKKSTKKIYVRFISSQFFTDSSGNLVPSAQGGLEETSIWRINVNYRTMLLETLGNPKEEIWVFTREDINQMKSYTNTYGHVLNALDKFIDSFYRCRK